MGKFGFIKPIYLPLGIITKQCYSLFKSGPLVRAFPFFVMTALFSSSTPTCNVFCSELTVIALSGASVKDSFHQALERAAAVLGENPFQVASNLPMSGVFCGTVKVDGVEKQASVRFDADNRNYPTVS